MFTSSSVSMIGPVPAKVPSDLQIVLFPVGLTPKKDQCFSHSETLLSGYFCAR